MAMFVHICGASLTPSKDEMSHPGAKNHRGEQPNAKAHSDQHEEVTDEHLKPMQETLD